MRKGLKKGFTLIELLVVIAIIAILATVVIINVTGARAKSERAKVASDMGVATKIASACVSFSGSLTVLTGVSSVGTVCATMPDDTTEKAAATGTYPAMPSSGHFTLAVTSTASTYSAVVTEATSGTGKLTCTLNGCTKDANWK